MNQTILDVVERSGKWLMVIVWVRFLVMIVIGS